MVVHNCCPPTAYESELQHLHSENHEAKIAAKIRENEMTQNTDSIGSLYSTADKTDNESNNNILKIGYDSTQPENESSLEISGYSTMMNELKNQNNNPNMNDQNIGNNSQIHKLLRKMSDNTSHYVKSQTKSDTNN